MTTIHHMKQNIFLTMLFCLLTALPQSAGAKGDSIRTFTVEHPLVYEDSWDLWPYVFLNENGEPDGYNIDLLKLIFKELDMPYIIKLMPTLDAQNDLIEGKSDLMLRMDAEFTQGNSIFGNNVVQLFTHSIVTPTDKPVKIENIRSLARYTVIVHEGSFSHYLIKKNKWAKKIEPFDDMKEAIQKVSTLDDGIIVWNTMSLKWLMQKYHTDNLSITPIDLPYGEYKFMSNNPRLLQVIDSVYTSLKANDKLQPIQNKWFYPERTYSGLPGWLTKTAYVFGIMAFAVLLYYLVYHFRVRQMTKAVRKRNNRLALILRTSQVTLWTCDVQTRTLTWLDQQGKPIKDIALDDFVHHYRPEDVRHLQLALDDIAAGRKDSATLDVQVFEEGGRAETNNYMLSLSVLHRNRNGRPETILCTRSNVTKELLRQLKVKDTMLHYQAIFNSAMVDMVAYSPEGKVTDVNQKALESMKVSLDTIRKMNISIQDVLGMPDLDIEHLEPIYVTQIYKSGIPDSRPLNNILKRGKLYYELQVVPVRDSQNKLIAIFGTGRNVTEVAMSYLQAQRNSLELEAANKEIREYIHNMDYVLAVGGIRVVTYNPDTHLLTVFNTMEEGKGLKLTQSRMLNLVAPSSKKMAERILNGMDSRSDILTNTEILTVLRSKDQQPLYLQFHFVPVHDQEGHLKEYFGMARDISELKAIEIKLAQETLRAQDVEVVKNAFLHNMSFEIRTPLTAVVGFSELFQMEHTPEDEAVFIQEIKDNSAKLLKLINDILFLSRLDAGMITMRPSPIDFAASFPSKVEAAWSHDKVAGVDYIIGNPFRKLIIEIDDTNVSIIIDKIVLNAVQHTTTGQVRVRYDYVGDQLIVVVEDTGSGIPNENLDHIFERFITGDGNTERAGLGLSICHDLIQHLGGKINITSTVGKGTNVWFSIPCKLIEADRI